MAEWGPRRSSQNSGVPRNAPLICVQRSARIVTAGRYQRPAKHASASRRARARLSDLIRVRQRADVDAHITTSNGRSVSSLKSLSRRGRPLQGWLGRVSRCWWVWRPHRRHEEDPSSSCWKRPRHHRCRDQHADFGGKLGEHAAAYCLRRIFALI